MIKFEHKNLKIEGPWTAEMFEDLELLSSSDWELVDATLHLKRVVTPWRSYVEQLTSPESEEEEDNS